MNVLGADELAVCSAGNEANYRTAAYEAITSYLTQATPDAIPVVQNTVVTILQRMEQLLSMQVRVAPLSSHVQSVDTPGLYRTRFWAWTTAITGTSSRATSAASSS